MALFARRALKRMLDHLSAHLPDEACQKLAHGLNQPSTAPLTACPDADDDILEFTFAPDAAIGKLVAKQTTPAEDPKQPINPG